MALKVDVLQKLASVKWQVIDQAISSASNMVLTFAIAMQVSGVEFGSFSVAFVAWMLVLGGSRVAGGELLLLRSAEGRSIDADSTKDFLSFQLWLAVAVSSVCALIAWSLGGTTQTMLVTLAVLLPGLLLQDGARYFAFAVGQPTLAVRMDLVWLVSQVAFMALLLFTPVMASASLLTGAWGLAAILSLATGAFADSELRSALSGSWRFKATVEWVSEEFARLSGYAFDFAIGSGASQAVWIGLAAIVGVEGVGGLRGAMALFGPALTLIGGLRLFVLPKLRSLAVKDPGDAYRASLRAAAGFSSAMVVWVLIVLAGIPALGPIVLGETWPMTRQVVGVVALTEVLWAANIVFADLVKVTARIQRLLLARSVIAVLLLLLMSVGGLLGGFEGAALGRLIYVVVSLLVWIGVAYRVAR